ncbi:MAG TPA: STAS domain-containing protein, partial [Acidimicrobiales bacterium]|nr:STAS domain-containing protein [Acidimicrobiales bacterium]
LTTTRTDDGVVVKIEGELDMATAPRLRDELLRLADEGVRLLTADLSDMSFVDATGIGVLVGGLQRQRAGGGDLVLRSPRPTATKVLVLTGLDRAFVVEDMAGSRPAHPGCATVRGQAGRVRARLAGCEVDEAVLLPGGAS